MVRVTQPLGSEKASGKFGPNIVFRCGKFVLMKPKPTPDDPSLAQKARRDKFTNGAHVWTFDLTLGQQQNWEVFAMTIKHPKGFFYISTPLGSFEIDIGEKKNWKECIVTGKYNGYQYFMACYLRFGPDGWTDYPNAPPFVP